MRVRLLRYASDVSANRKFRKRLVVSNAYWALSFRANETSMEVFSLPATHVAALFEEETASRLKFRLGMQRKSNEYAWFLDSTKISDAELNLLVRTAFKELTSRSLQETHLSSEVKDAFLSGDVSLMAKLRALISDKHHFAEKLVVQQESLQADLARNIHDGAIGRLMVLKSSLLSKRAPATEEIVQDLDEVIESLRETCCNLSPRDLRDWGLAVIVQDLVSALAKRTGTDCDIAFSDQLPVLAPDVDLHVFRIIQESLINVEKHARATEVRVTMQAVGQDLVVEVRDNGKGMEPNRTHSGSGLSIMRERLELIRSNQAASLTVESVPDKGTCVRLIISTNRSPLNEAPTPASIHV